MLEKYNDWKRHRLRNDGVKHTVYASSALKTADFPPRTKLFPLGPSATVMRRPSKVKVNISPYWMNLSPLFLPDINYGLTNLRFAVKEKLDGVCTIRDGRTNNREPMKDMGWIRRLPRYQLPFDTLSDIK